MKIAFELFVILCHSPSINEHKYIISSNSKHNKNDQIMQWPKVVTLQYSSVEQRRNRKTEQNKTDSYEGQVQTSKMVDQIEENKTNRIDGIVSVLLNQSSKNVSGNEWVEHHHFKSCFVIRKLLSYVLLNFIYELFYEVVLLFLSIFFV